MDDSILNNFMLLLQRVNIITNIDVFLWTYLFEQMFQPPNKFVELGQRMVEIK